MKRERNEEMLAMHYRGRSYRQIAKVFGVTPMRVYVIVKREKAREGK